MSLKVGCFTVTVTGVGEGELGNGNLAQFESTSLAIKYYRHAHPQAQAESILHECWHAADDQWFSPDSQPDEEERVRFCTANMIQLLNNNPKEIAMILAAINSPDPLVEPPAVVSFKAKVERA